MEKVIYKVTLKQNYMEVVFTFPKQEEAIALCDSILTLGQDVSVMMKREVVTDGE